MAVQFSAWVAVLVALCAYVCVCVFKSSCQMHVKDVWTTLPCNSSRHWPCLSHPAIKLVYLCGLSCERVHRHVFEMRSQCVQQIVRLQIARRNAFLFFFLAHSLLILEIIRKMFHVNGHFVHPCK